ncbi:hypothetical protein ACEWY4_012504 [Coilia grayii]|uniref:Uncharacterized protein n=1 Tax=Coilia grayii TaxID=363190 RepID=A0ABD1K0Q2_9TELE
MYNFTEVYNAHLADGAIPECLHLSYRRFRDAVLCFMELLQLDLAEGYSCPVCQDNYNHSERVLVSHAPLRKLLVTLSTNAVTPAEAAEMVKLAQQHSPFLLPLLRGILREGRTQEKEPQHSLLREISKNTPACSIIHPNTRVDTLVQGLEALNYRDVEGHPCLMKILAEECPLFFDLVGAMGTFPQEANQKARDTLMKPPFHTPLTVPEHPGDYFPNMPLVRDRGIFDADMSREDSRLIDCKKMATRHPSLIPGVSTLHGECLGFAIMEQVESVEVPFRILRTRFQKCPELVVYDNVCQLHTYALRRDPHFVKDSRFLVDRLHWRNHSGCSEGYNLDAYPQNMCLNSQLAEQTCSAEKNEGAPQLYEQG